MSGEYVCNLCEVEPFRAPADPIGVALMQQHLAEDHDRTTSRPYTREETP